MKKKSTETVTITVLGKHKAVLRGDKNAVQLILKVFVRGAAEMHIDREHVMRGRSREEVVQSMCDRIRISEKHYQLGESDGFKCDLSDA